MPAMTKATKTASWERISTEATEYGDEVLFLYDGAKIHGRVIISSPSYLVVELITLVENRYKQKTPGDELTFYKPHIKKIGRRLK